MKYEKIEKFLFYDDDNFELFYIIMDLKKL